MSATTKTLVVNADDFGLTSSINQGILKCYNEGIVTCASILSTGEAFHGAVAISKEHNLDVGVHLSLTQDRPLSGVHKIPSLVRKDGFFPPNYGFLIKRVFGEKISLDEVRSEFRAQIEAIIGSGLKPSFINSHQHIHVFPGLFDVVLDLMQEYGISWVRIPDSSFWHSLRNPSFNSIAKLCLLACSRLARRKISEKGFYTSDSFEGLFQSGHLSKFALDKILDRLEPGVTELMCHPGLEDDQLHSRYSWGYLWEEEVKALCDSEIIDKIHREKIELTTFSSLIDGK